MKRWIAIQFGILLLALALFCALAEIDRLLF